MNVPIFTTLTGAVAVTSLIGERIYRHGDAPQNVARGYVTWYALATPENTLSEIPGIDRVSVTIDCWSPDDTEVETLADAVRDTIEPLAHMTSRVNDNRDRSATKLYRITLQFDWWLSR